jgi:hypothetical protein
MAGYTQVAYLWALLAALGALLLGLQLLPATAAGRRGRAAVLISAGLTVGLLLDGSRYGAGSSSWAVLWLLLPAAAILHRRHGRAPAADAAVLRRLTPGLIAFIRTALSGHEAPSAVLGRYSAQDVPARRPMQQLVIRALQCSEQQRLRPFAALAVTARTSGCRELLDAAEALAQAEAEGHPVEQVLAAQQLTLEYLLQSDFRRLIRRRSVYLLLLTAISLVGGILLNVLYVMTEGGRLFSQLGLQ